MVQQSYRQVFCYRLKQARKLKGLSQKKLGILAGIDEFVASTRINRYEKGVHEVDIETAQKLAVVLEVPLAFLYTEDNLLAELIMNYHKLPDEAKLMIHNTLNQHTV
ncbi:helix-turn-helix domain-containing protein [Commensalibacter oyaizuii]|uniref:Helix-turn-helix transcriptional regulator n=1 Tax=Commensalibacter oyaizuii TaxID=3043873 RepID=A0ABT6Q3N1_9PROT|nr:helix-turn-helix transcriptional regulator [Commensalibacter sp. TBRC 16381]MDI2091578.1 helix-turn-helix transcriptional regulator [Commensalibacter sp. TBRC 16381]